MLPRLPPLLGALPIAPLLAVVARHLAAVLQEHQQAQAWGATPVRLTAQLLGVTDVAQIRQRGWGAAEEICRYAAKAAGKNRVQVAGPPPPVSAGALTPA